MAIEVFTPMVYAGGSGEDLWITYYDPKIYTQSGWEDILFGEIYTGNGPNNGWSYFYVRINVVDPVITLNSKTQTSITVNVTHSNPDSDRVRVFVYRVGNQAGGQYLPNSSGTTGTVSGTFTQTGLALGTSYTFRAYAEYLDGSGNVMITSDVTEFTVATNTYNLYTPSIPTGSRGYSGSGSTYTATTSFTSSSNPLFSQNGSASYIQFEMQEYPVGSITPNIYTLNSTNLSNSDSLQSKTVTFTNLGLGSQCICRARTVYTTVGEVSDWSEYSSVITNYNWTRQYVPSQAGWTHLANTSAYTGFTASGTSTKNSYSYASDGSNNEWISDPYTTTTGTTNQTRTISTIEIGFGVIQHDTSSSHNIVSGSTGTTTLNSITYYAAGQVFVDATYIIFEMTDQGGAPSGSATIFNSGLSGVDGVTRSIQSTSVINGVRQIRFLRGSAASGQVSKNPSSSYMVLPSTSFVGGVRVNTMDGTYSLTSVDSNTFYFIGPSTPSLGIAKTNANGSVTYPVTSTVQVPKGAGTETVFLWARPNGLPSVVRDVQLENLYYTHGGVASSSVSVTVNGTNVTTRSVSADASFTSVTPQLAPDRTSSGTIGGNGWYVSTSVQRGLSGSLYYSTVDEVRFRYSYETLA